MSLRNMQTRQAFLNHWVESSQGKPFVTTNTNVDRNKIQRLLILDSSFNPPTKAHANLLKKAWESKPSGYFDASLLLISSKNADKQLTGASIPQRLCMMELMAKEFPNTLVGLTSHAKFVDKAESIQSWFGERSVQLEFILGYDTITRLFDPKYYTCPVKQALQSFFDTSRLICADRGSDTEAFWQGLGHEYKHVIDRIQLDPSVEAISSTKAREALRQQDVIGLKALLNPMIVQFILEEKIYVA